MCIVFITTSHPDYALILVNNRDEFILRPTSRPRWWKTKQKPVSRKEAAAVAAAAASQQDQEEQKKKISILSAQDLQRPEHGTWLGLTRTGKLAVLTNYRETDTHDAAHPVHAARSRGEMVTAWLAADEEMETDEFVREMLRDGGVKGVGGFSLVCGRLGKRRRRSMRSRSGEAGGEAGGGRRRRRTQEETEPLAIISNRYDSAEEVPYVAGARDETVGLSNQCFMADERWPKIEDGKKAVAETVAEAAATGAAEDELVRRLFAVLDRNTLSVAADAGFEEVMMAFKNSVFIPPVGNDEHVRHMKEAREKAPRQQPQQQEPVFFKMEDFGGGEGFDDDDDGSNPDQSANGSAKNNNTMGFSQGMYGTQRQTVVLVDWDGNVKLVERALFDAYGREVERGAGDVRFEFKIEGWEERGNLADGAEERGRL